MWETSDSLRYHVLSTLRSSIWIPLCLIVDLVQVDSPNKLHPATRLLRHDGYTLVEAQRRHLFRLTIICSSRVSRLLLDLLSSR